MPTPPSHPDEPQTIAGTHLSDVHDLDDVIIVWPPPRRRWLRTAGVALAAAATVGAFLAIAQPWATYEVTGTISVHEEGMTTSAGTAGASGQFTCQGRPGYYDDLHEGSEVVRVYDEKRALVGVAKIGAGRVESDNPRLPQHTYCVFPIDVLSIPAGSDIYWIEVTDRWSLSVQPDREPTFEPGERVFHFDGHRYVISAVLW